MAVMMAATEIAVAMTPRMTKRALRQSRDVPVYWSFTPPAAARGCCRRRQPPPRVDDVTMAMIFILVRAGVRRMMMIASSSYLRLVRAGVRRRMMIACSSYLSPRPKPPPLPPCHRDSSALCELCAHCGADRLMK